MLRMYILFLFLLPLILKAQNVGIGTVTPTEKLQVAGNIAADTLKINGLQLPPDAGAGKILTSDASGNATWENLIVPPGEDTNDNVGYGVWGDCATNGNIAGYQPVADTAVASNRHFGSSVSVSGNNAAVGASNDYAGQGSVSMYVYNGQAWELLEKLADPDGASSHSFGSWVCISGNHLIVGSPFDSGANTFDGSVCFFHFNGSSWDFIEKIRDNEFAPSSRFGSSVCLRNNLAVIGAPTSSGGGTACVYQYNGTNWEFVDRLLDPGVLPGDAFGYSISLSENNVIVGSVYDDVGNNINQGSASIFHLENGAWVWKQKLTDNTGAGSDYFGNSVSITDSDVLIGAPYDNAVYSGQGTASFFRYNGTSWVLADKISDVTPNSAEYYGSCTFLSGRLAMINARYDGTPTINTSIGSVTLYQKVGIGWQKMQTIFDPGGNPYDAFGDTLGLDAVTGHFVIGVPAYMSFDGKVVFGKLK